MGLKLNLGSGDTHIGGFISVDKYDQEADVQADICALPYEDESVEEIVAYQVIEHIPYHQTKQMFQEMYRVLQPGGFMTTECPDLEYIARQIVETGRVTETAKGSLWGGYHRPWDINRYGEAALFLPGAIHYHGFTFRDLRDIADELGFEVERLTKDMCQMKDDANLGVRWYKPRS